MLYVMEYGYQGFYLMNLRSTYFIHTIGFGDEPHGNHCTTSNHVRGLE